MEIPYSKNILNIPSLSIFNDDWDLLQKYLKKRGNPLYGIGNGFLFLPNIKNLGNLVYFDGYLDLYDSAIESLGELRWIGKTLNLGYTKHIVSFGKLEYVGRNLDLTGSSLLYYYGTENSVRYKIEVGGEIYI